MLFPGSELRSRWLYIVLMIYTHLFAQVHMWVNFMVILALHFVLRRWSRGACSQRAPACSACSCSNSALFLYGGQECMHVSPHPSGCGWNRPQRLGVGERERTGFPPHPSLFIPGLPPHLRPTILYERLYGLLFTVSQRRWRDQRTHLKKLVHVSPHLWCI